LIVDGNPADDFTILEDSMRLRGIMIDGSFAKLQL
jgi:hypothetical protein